MRVALFVESYYPFVNGVITHVDTLKQGLLEQGHEVLVCTLDPKAHFTYIKDNVVYFPALTLKKIYGYGVGNPFNVKRLLYVKDFDPDIIHLHTEFTMGMFAIFLSKQLHKPVVYTLHTMYDDYVYYLFPEKMPKRFENITKPATHRFIKKMASYATEIIGPSTKVAEYLRLCKVYKHVNIIPNTIDLSEFVASNVDQKIVKQTKEKLDIKPTDITVGFVGRLGKEKSIDVLIDYFTQSFKDKKEFKLFIIGDGPDKENLVEQIQNLGMEDQIKLLGRIDHTKIVYYLHSFNLYATASLSEMNSISMLEAMASGLFVLQKLDVYNRDQIVSGTNGDVFETADEFKELVQQEADMTEEERDERRQKVSDFTCRYGTKEFTEKIVSVYKRALYKYQKNEENKKTNVLFFKTKNKEIEIEEEQK